MSESAPDAEPPKLTPAERARRRRRRAWIPTGIIVLIILTAVIIALELQRGGGAKPVVEQAGDSRFDKAGIAEIVRTADAQLDVRGPRQASAIGLPTNGSITVGPLNNIAAELDLVGTGGVESLYVDSFRVNSASDYLTTITTTSTEYDYTDLHNELVQDRVLGLTTAQMAAFINAMPNGAGGPSSYFALDVGTGTALGIPTDVKVKCSGLAGCTITTTTTLARK